MPTPSTGGVGPEDDTGVLAPEGDTDLLGPGNVVTPSPDPAAPLRAVIRPA